MQQDSQAERGSGGAKPAAPRLIENNELSGLALRLSKEKNPHSVILKYKY